MFFARKVVFVEGETEHTIIPFLADKLEVFDPDVSIVDCGGKHNLPLYIKVANAFNLHYTVVHDEDPIPENCPEKDIERKRRTFQLNTEIQNIVDTQSGSREVFAPDFEGVAGISHTQSEKKGKALAAVEFFWDKHRDDIPEALANAVRSCFRR
jgi:CRISPR-associated exonuclease Cas4